MARRSIASPGGLGWWATKSRQLARHLRARVTRAERDALASWLTAAQLDLFDSMPVADRRHGLDVAAALRADGVADDEVLLAGLLHDAGKGHIGVLPRIAFSLGQAYGRWVWRLAGVVPGFGPAIERLAAHAETSAGLAAAAGCTARTTDLIRWQEEPRDPEFGELLRIADEAS